MSFKDEVETFARAEIRKYYDESDIHEGDADDMQGGIKIGATFAAELILKEMEAYLKIKRQGLLELNLMSDNEICCALIDDIQEKIETFIKPETEKK